ncbi:Uncharacterised protein [Legionella sainthelensi]|nr:Uncharacterised protein [Legionella sainthelensi]
MIYKNFEAMNGVQYNSNLSLKWLSVVFTDVSASKMRLNHTKMIYIKNQISVDWADKLGGFSYE